MIYSQANFLRFHSVNMRPQQLHQDMLPNNAGIEHPVGVVGIFLCHLIVHPRTYPHAEESVKILHS